MPALALHSLCWARFSRSKTGRPESLESTQRRTVYVISGTKQHSFIIPELFALLVKRDKAAAATIARYHMRAIQDCHRSENDSQLRCAKSIRIDLIVELLEAIDKTAPANAYFASVEVDGVLNWAFFREDDNSQSSG